MEREGVMAYIIPGTDPHASEYMAPHWAEMTWISGFLGESGTAVVTMDKALLWTDSRYYLQAEAELKGSTFELMRESDVDCPSITKWLTDHFVGPSQSDCKTAGAVGPASPVGPQAKLAVGVNAEMYSVNGYDELRKQLADGGLELHSADLIKDLWTENRPAIPDSILYEYDEKYAGESVESKLARVRKAMAEKRADAIIISALDEIGWLLNIRGKDVDYTPCLISYVVVESNKCTIFVAPAKLDDKARKYLSRIDVEVRDYTDIYDYLRAIDATCVMYDGARVNEALYEAINPAVKRKLNVTPSPVQVMMSEKNEVEIAGERQAMLTDAVALTRFFRWLYEDAFSAPQTEITLADKLHEFRAQGQNFTDESFCTIAGWKGNGAIVHYHATPEECARVEGEGVLLLDSGGQYLDGTTDITRTVWIGDEKHIPADLKRDYTLVMKGHIALARARFPRGTRGNQLDVLAHQYMWAEGISYGHGTGHGVGHFMGCHEGPANIRMDNNRNPIRLGNVFSDEPGIYRAGKWGIRTENLMVTRKVSEPQPRSTGEEYYEFETLTLCYYDTRLLDRSMLTADEIAWINAYHERVYREVSPMLDKETAEWLKHKCKAL